MERSRILHFLKYSHLCLCCYYRVPLLKFDVDFYDDLVVDMKGMKDFQKIINDKQDIDDSKRMQRLCLPAEKRERPLKTIIDEVREKAEHFGDGWIINKVTMLYSKKIVHASYLIEISRMLRKESLLLLPSQLLKI